MNSENSMRPSYSMTERTRERERERGIGESDRQSERAREGGIVRQQEKERVRGGIIEREAEGETMNIFFHTNTPIHFVWSIAENGTDLCSVSAAISALHLALPRG